MHIVCFLRVIVIPIVYTVIANFKVNFQQHRKFVAINSIRLQNNNFIVVKDWDWYQWNDAIVAWMNNSLYNIAMENTL